MTIEDIKEQTEEISLLIDYLNRKYTELKYSYNDNMTNDLKLSQLRNCTTALSSIKLEISNSLHTVIRTIERNILSL